MIDCITRKDMKFGGYFIPARSKGVIINKPQYDKVVPGLNLLISISLYNMRTEEERKEGVPLSHVERRNELESMDGSSSARMIGIVVCADGNQVYIDGGHKFYEDAHLTGRQIERILGQIPPGLHTDEYRKDYKIRHVIDYMENDFAEWVGLNCEFKPLTKQDIENGEGFDGAAPGDRVLSDAGLEAFFSKQREHQNKLEAATGFTYGFKGGLIWD
ncbi:hypothetical protein DFR58_101111 [Anaerobacterium chartisolvens]|uniref:Uncharacterized protein n=1 Tax=Anaerobacterium chartisolvens TaxID=1297424 RepID=A0A369BH75_9FIRM|nr:hypothetical protein [Anaerobacterium chartisolvens]RCX20909.1 hypothetical protein DFR58_101111 [Anaerobacterium chartisolvens]